MDGTTNDNTTNTHTYAGATPMVNGGTYSFKVRAYDAAGNLKTSVCSSALVIDQDPPTDNTANLQFTDAYDADGNDIAVTWTAFTDASAGISDHRIKTYTAPGCGAGEVDHGLTGSATNSDSAIIDGLTDGTYYAKVTAYDSAGNSTESACSTDSIIVDTTNPAAVTMDRNDGDIHKGSIIVTFSGGTDTNFDNYYYTTDGGVPSCASTSGGSATINPNSHGTATQIRVIACDLTGNSSTESTITLHNIIPTIAGYYTNAPNWGDWVADPSSKTSAACSGTGYCFHGGETLGIVLDSVTSCGDLAMTDTLGTYDWECDASTGTAIMIGEFKDTKSVADILNPTSWKNNAVTLTGSNVLDTVDSTSSNAYYSNTVQALPNNPSALTVLGTAGTVYTLGANLTTAGHHINANKVSIVSLGGPKLLSKDNGIATNCNHASGGTAGPDAVCMLIAQNVKYLYLDLDYDGVGGGSQAQRVNDVVNFNGVTHSIIERMAIDDAKDNGIFMKASSENYLIDLDIAAVHTANNIGGGTTGDCIRLEAASNNNTFIHTRVQVCEETGMRLDASVGNRFHDVVANNNTYIGLWLTNTSTDNIFTDLELSNHNDASFGMGMQIASGSNDNTFVGFLAANNSAGINIESSDGNLLKNVTLVNNTTEGILIDGTTPDRNSLINVSAINNQGHNLHISFGSNNNVHNLIASNSPGYNIQLDAGASPNVFSGVLKMDVAGASCWTDANTGLADSSCANTNTSSATLTTSVDISSEFKGKNATTSSHVGITDWLTGADFLHWRLQGGTFPDAANAGPCTGGTCEQWDWRIANASTHHLNANAISGGNDTFTHTWSDASVTTFLIYAREISWFEPLDITNVGDDNGLCEDSESCVSTRNIGAYQGDPTSIVRNNVNDIATGGTIQNVEMWKYNTNGVP